VSSASVSGPGTSSRRPLVITLAVVGVLALIYGILNLVVKGLPKAITLISHKNTHTTHPLHAIVAIVVGLILLGLAYWQNKKSA
jgi:uncharacterized membrane protein YidH (DUF202 family)